MSVPRPSFSALDRLPVVGVTCTCLVVTNQEPLGPHSASPQTYVDCLTDAGALPLLLPIVAEGHAAAYLSRIDGLLLTGGLDLDPFHFGEEPKLALGRIDPQRDAIELALARGAHDRGMPILAICRGQQLLNVALGGTLHQHLPDAYEGALRHDQIDLHPDSLGHSIEIQRGSRLHEILGLERARVNTYHHQGVDRLAGGLCVTARAPDGVVEGIEDPAHPFCVSVQWHPERRGDDPISQALFLALIEASRRAAALGKGERARPQP